MKPRQLVAGMLLGLLMGGPVAGAPVEPADGRKIYNFRCYFCHGYSGDGKTLAATFLQPPPADFTALSAERMSVGQIAETLRRGKPGTAMKSFSGILGEAEIKAVAAFVRDEFIVRKAPNTRYHTSENGWPEHERYRAAYPFAQGQISLAVPDETLDQAQREGKRLYLGSCVTCHDRGAKATDTVDWDARPLSYPRNNFSYTRPPAPDAMAEASPYVKHDRVPRVANLTAVEKRGERLFQDNCAFCHGADGSGKNWIGQFLEPHPRNLRASEFMFGMSRDRLFASIRDGLQGTSMPAWKSVLTDVEIRSLVDYIARAFHPLPAWSSSNPEELRR